MTRPNVREEFGKVFEGIEVVSSDPDAVKECLTDLIDAMRMYNLNLAYSDARSGHFRLEIDLAFDLREILFGTPQISDRDDRRYTVRANSDEHTRLSQRFKRRELLDRRAELENELRRIREELE